MWTLKYVRMLCLFWDYVIQTISHCRLYHSKFQLYANTYAAINETKSNKKNSIANCD